MEMMLNGLKYKYVSTGAFGHKVMSYVNMGGPNGSEQWVNDSETKFPTAFESFEQFEKACQEIDEMYN